jgi:type I restriction enzyme M protein
MPHCEKGEPGISKVFDNDDFGYYKVTVDRPKRLSAQITQARVDSLRFLPALADVMQWIYQEMGDEVYNDAKGEGLSGFKKDIEKHIEEQELNLTSANKKKLLDVALWQSQKDIVAAAQCSMGAIGTEQHDDFNAFKATVETELQKLKKAEDINLSAGGKSQLYNGISWRNESAAKVLKKVHKLNKTNLKTWLADYACDNAADLQDYGYWLDEAATAADKKAAAILNEYEADSDLRDTENVPLVEEVLDYFLREVRPHVTDAWLNIDKVQIGYEISFNKYFYQHKALRSLADVTADILQLEAQTDGLLKKLVSFGEVGR